MPKFELKITDKYGLWGSLILHAPTETDAVLDATNYIAEKVFDSETEADLETLHCAPVLLTD